MSEHLGFNSESEPIPEDSLELADVLGICRSYDLPVEQMAELDVFDDVIELIGTASIWIQEAGYDLDEFLTKIDALGQSEPPVEG